MDTMPNKSSPKQKRLRPEEIVTLSREIQAMVAAGVPLDMGVRSAAGGFSPNLESAAHKIADRLEQGASIYEAFRDEASVPPVFRAILVAGFRCGETESVLRDITNLTQMQIALRQALKIGLVYPLIIVFLAMALFLIVINGMLPRLAEFHVLIDAEVPRWMSVLMNIPVPRFALVFILLAFFASIIWLIRTGRLTPLGGLLWMPGVSGVVRDFSVAHFSHLLSLLVSYGVPLPEALRLTAESIPDGPLKQQTYAIATNVERGEEISDSLNGQAAFPPFLKWLLVAGQRDSELGTALKHASEFYQSRAQGRAIWLSKVVPAMCVVVVGGSVTFLYSLSVFGPMVELWSKMAQN